MTNNTNSILLCALTLTRHQSRIKQCLYGQMCWALYPTQAVPNVNMIYPVAKSKVYEKNWLFKVNLARKLTVTCGLDLLLRAAYSPVAVRSLQFPLLPPPPPQVRKDPKMCWGWGGGRWEARDEQGSWACEEEHKVRPVQRRRRKKNTFNVAF